MDDETLRYVTALRGLGATEVEIGPAGLRVRFEAPRPEAVSFDDLPEPTEEQLRAEAERLIYHSSRS